MAADTSARRPRRAAIATNDGSDDRTTDDALAAFVPRLASELDVHGAPSWASIDGSMLSADISGFTALSERLAGKGKAGAEEITELVNKCFTALINAAYGYGGEVLKFGGDALLVLFRGDGHGRRAVDAGLSMQHALHLAPAAKRAQLTMTVGVAGGPFDVYLAGSRYREILVTGERASEVIRLEGAAAKGDTLVSTDLAALLPDTMLVRDESGGVVVQGRTGDPTSGPAPRHHADADLTPFVPTAVRQQLAGFSGLGGEHRLVTVGFLMVGGVDALVEQHGHDHVAGAFHWLVDDVVDTCTTFGVTVLHTDIAPDGVKFVLCAGAPVNPGDTSDAMLQAALAIAAVESPFVLRQGVQTGRVFAGFLGSQFRRTYTLMGDPVNTAARMLGKAADRDVVAVASVVADTRTVFVSEELEPFLVKGKTEPITAHKVHAASDEVRRDNTSARLYGRAQELEIVGRSIGELGEVIVLTGPAGVGKSRLLDAAWDVAEGLTAFQGSCTPYGAASPYSVFRPLLRVGSGIDVSADPATAGQLLTKIVTQAAPSILPMLPLLAVPFGADVSDSPEATAIDPEFRRARIHDVVVDFLDQTLDGPVFLVVEDVHWIDDASAELLTHLMRAAASRPWTGVLTRRPGGAWQIPDDVDHVRNLDVLPLSPDAIRALAIEVSERALADRDLDVIVERSDGNPLFAIELSRAVSRSGGDALPDSIEGVIATRIDALPAAQRRLLRIASVFGREFELDQVSAVSREPVAIGAELDEMIERVGDGDGYRFVHAMYRDVAYEGLPFRQRRRLHGEVAGVLRSEADDADIAPLLSLHYSEARLHDEAWRYSLVAAASAESQHATWEAASAYERALGAARHARGLTAADRADVAERLGDQYYILGRFDDARRLFELARRAGADAQTRVSLMRRIGSVEERRGQPTSAIRWFRRAAQAVPGTTRDPEWLTIRADIAVAEAGLRTRLGEDDVCVELATRALADAERAGDKRVTALALERLHLGLVGLGAPDTTGAGRRALELHRELGDYSGMARTLTNLGVEAYYDSRWSEATDHYLEALSLAQSAGSVVVAATAAINSAEVLTDQGHWDRALELFEQALRNYESVRYAPGIATTWLFSAVASTRCGDFDVADERLAAARTEMRRLGMLEHLDELDTRQLELDVLRGDASRTRCDELAGRFAGDPVRLSRIERCRALLTDDLAWREQSVLRIAAIDGAPDFERAQSLRVLVAIDPDTALRSARLDEIDGVFAGLGVTHPPPLPGEL